MSFLIVLLFLDVAFTAGMDSGIIGGKVSKAHSRAYMASLQVEGHHRCGGTLIREDYVLTSAHCFNRSEFPSRARMEVVLGAQDILQQEKSQQRIPVKKFIRHPMFQKSQEINYSYDIMLLKLEKKAELNRFVKTLALPKKDGATPPDVKCVIAGWGTTRPDGDRPSRLLQEAVLRLQESGRCERRWQHYFHPDRMLCGASNGRQAFCQGDSGSPLVCNSKPQGIATFTFGGDCTNTDYPPVYVKISYFLPWIKKKIGSARNQRNYLG